MMRLLICLLLLLVVGRACAFGPRPVTVLDHVWRSPSGSGRSSSSGGNMQGGGWWNVPRGGDVTTATATATAGVDVNDLANAAYGWMTALGGPAALIAGAVVATVYDVNSSGSMATLASDPTWVRWAKKWNQILLATAFAMEVICIFVVTVTGTMLSSYADRPTDYSKPSLVVAKSALGFLKETYEFEYLTSRIAFLQGLLNWLAAIALEHAIPTGVSGGGPSQRAMDVFIASCLGTLILLMLSFYNSHMTFYPNYLSMLGRYAVVLWERYFHRWPPRPLSLLSGPAVLFTLYLGYKAIIAPVDIQDCDSSSSS